MSVLAVPGWIFDQARKSPRWISLPALGMVLLLVLLALSARRPEVITLPPAQVCSAVVMDPFEVKLKKDGELQAVTNTDIICQVEGSTTITQLVKEGTSAKKGDTLLVLDSAQITQRLEDCTLDLQRAEADLSSAREMREIQISKNAADLEAAEVALKLAALDRQQYTEGTYPQQLASAKVDVDMAAITLKNRQDDLAQIKKLYAKDFVTSADMKKAELDALTASNALDKATTTLKVISDYSHAMDLTSKQSSFQQAEQRLQRTKRENAAQLAWQTAGLSSKEQALLVIKRRYERLQQQLAATKIVAPEDGIVIYGSSGDHWNQNPIQEGSTVRERQLLLRLPDVSEMKVVVRINESMVPQLAEGQPAMVRITGVRDPVRATVSNISPVADSSNRSWNPDLREYPVDLVLSQTPRNLKPGMSAAVEILITSKPATLAVPLDTVYSAGGTRYAFLYDGQAIHPTAVTTGVSNEQFVEITSGLAEGQRVVRLLAGQGRDLLEKAGVQVTPAVKSTSGKRGKHNDKTDPREAVPGNPALPAGAPAPGSPPPALAPAVVAPIARK